MKGGLLLSASTHPQNTVPEGLPKGIVQKRLPGGELPKAKLQMMLDVGKPFGRLHRGETPACIEICLYMSPMIALLLHTDVTMSAASAACRLFVTAVLPGLFPYMVLSLMAVSRVQRPSPPLVMLLGWGGGSPTGARLLSLCAGLNRQEQVRLAVSCATMSPMFLLGTVGGWLESGVAGVVCLISVIAGGWLAGLAAGRAALCRPSAQGADRRTAEGRSDDHPAALAPLSFGAAVEQSVRTMLLVCGTMVMLRVFAALAAAALPSVCVLPVTTLLEVTTGAVEIAGLPLPLMWKTALIAGAAGFGGMAILMQNRAVYPAGFMPLGQQVLWQAAHGGFSFLLALGMMWLLC